MSILPEADWDHHKENIRQLYCIEQKELQYVQEEMKRRHGFEATAFQYEKHFKRWKFRKYLTKEEWAPIRQKVLARKREGKESDVYLEGVLVSAKKVKRCIGRYQQNHCEMSLSSYDCASEPPTPDGVTIATPTPIGRSSNFFGDLFISRYFASLLYQASPQGRNTVYPASHAGTIAGLSMHFTNTPEVLALPHWPSETSFAGYTGSDVETRIIELGNDTEGIFHQHLDLSQKLLGHTESFKALQSMIFLASNNFLDSADCSIRRTIINWLQEEKNAHLLNQLLSVGGPTAKSTVEALYPYALEGRNTSIIKVFIDLGCDPNISCPNLSLHGSSGVTALGFAIENQDSKLVRFLLGVGADPNKTSIYGDDDDFCCPVVLSILKFAEDYSRIARPEEDEEDEEDLKALIESLIQSGALVNGPMPVCRHIPLVEAVRHGYESVIRLLLKKGADVNLSDGYKRLPLSSAIKCLEFGSTFAASKSLSIVHLLLDAGAKVNNSSRYDIYLHSFDDGASTGSLRLLELLYTAGARPGRFAMINAVKGDNVEIVKFTLNAIGTGTNVPAQEPALVEAVKSSKSEMFSLVFETNAAQHDSYTLSLAIIEAISLENYQVVPQLLLAGRLDTLFAKRLQPAAIVAIYSGDLKCLELVLDTGVEVDSQLLIQAFKSGNEPVVRKLLDMRILQPSDERTKSSEDDDEYWDNVDRPNTCKGCSRRVDCINTSLLVAATEFGNCEIVKDLLEQGETFAGTRALIYAIRKGNLKMVTMLLEAGSPISASAWDQDTVMTPLQAAVKMRQSSFVRVLLENGADPEISPLGVARNFLQERRNPFFYGIKPPLHLAVSQGDIEIALMLLQAGANINNPQAKAWGCSALTLAIRRGEQQMFDLVVAQGADMLDSTALLEAVKHKHYPLARKLLTSCSRIGHKHRDTYGYEALCEASNQKSTDLVRLLLSAGINPNKRSHSITALGTAIIHTDGPALEIVEMLLRAGADPNGQIEPSGHSGGTRTPLIAAASIGDVSLVTALILFRADPNARPKGAILRSPLQAACEAGRLTVVQLLLDHNVDVNGPPSWHNGGTALQLAAINGNPEIVLALLNRGADVNAPAARVNGRTALEGAAENGRLDTIKLLFEAGVGIHSPYEGQYNRAIQFARKNGFLQIVRELVAMAEPSM